MAMYRESAAVAATETMTAATAHSVGAGKMRKQDRDSVWRRWSRIAFGNRRATTKPETTLTGPRPDIGIGGGAWSPGPQEHDTVLQDWLKRKQARGDG